MTSIHHNARFFQIFRIVCSWSIVSAICVPHVVAQEPTTKVAKKIDFSRDIQPILSENCYYCHGQDAEKRRADLRLDVEDSALDQIESGNASDSELIQRLISDDPGEVMPPPESNRSVTKDQIELIKRWIDQGAEWSDHWAYRPVSKTTDKKSGDAIDFYIARKLKEKSLRFSPRATKETLIRRVSLDLTGLPPTAAAVRAFVKNESPGAYEEMVDGYLASPAYGERMAWVWLDAARYADTNGYQGDNERTMWPWRDWVIKAYNKNMPFDQFSKWQLAGDLMPNATPEQILATGFNRNYPINGEGGRIPEENRVDYVMDMAETAGTVWLGLTFNCCRCHDHKYDRLTQNDYYSMFAFFNQTSITGGGGNAQTPPVLAVPNADQETRRSRIAGELRKLNEELDVRAKVIASQQLVWETEKAKKLSSVEAIKWEVLKPEKAIAKGAKLELQKDNSVLATGPNRPTDKYTFVGQTKLRKLSGIRLETLRHKSMTGGGLSRSSSSNFVLTDISVAVIEPGNKRRKIEIASATADYEQAGHAVQLSFDGKSSTGWAVWKKGKFVQREHQAVFNFEQPVEVLGNSKLEIVLNHQSSHNQHSIGRFRLSTTSHASPKVSDVNNDIAAALRLKPEDRSDKQKSLLKSTHHREDERYVSILKGIDDQKAKSTKLERSIPKVMVMADKKALRKTYRLDRGSYESPKNEVVAGLPSMFKPFSKGTKADRLALANWLFSKENRLTARVSSNRIWAMLFGTGLVKTMEDFGVQAETPSHPELLDWLASEYQETGWDTKRLMKTIMMSRTYQQSSKMTTELIEIDPKNRLLARASRFRMPSWMIRDHALSASGKLVRELGGPPVNSYQPEGVWEEASFGKKKFKLGTGTQLYRRSIYTFWRRIASPTMLFDNADRMVCSVKSYQTNTPLHALNTLNDITFVEASRLLATNVLKQNRSPEATLSEVYQIVVGRTPKRDEVDILINALKRTRHQFSQAPQAAEELISIGKSPIDKKIDTIELASWTSLCLAVLNLDEALTRQ